MQRERALLDELADNLESYRHSVLLRGEALSAMLPRLRLEASRNEWHAADGRGT
jgi:hypothetical protein